MLKAFFAISETLRKLPQNVPHSLDVPVETRIVQQGKSRCRIQCFVELTYEVLLIREDRWQERALLDSIKQINLLVRHML